MPSMDSMEALQAINQIDPEVIAIMLTSLASRDVVETSAKHGAMQFIRKDMPDKRTQPIIITKRLIILLTLAAVLIAAVILLEFENIETNAKAHTSGLVGMQLNPPTEVEV